MYVCMYACIYLLIYLFEGLLFAKHFLLPFRSGQIGCITTVMYPRATGKTLKLIANNYIWKIYLKSNLVSKTWFWYLASKRLLAAQLEI